MLKLGILVQHNLSHVKLTWRIVDLNLNEIIWSLLPIVGIHNHRKIKLKSYWKQVNTKK